LGCARRIAPPNANTERAIPYLPFKKQMMLHTTHATESASNMIMIGSFASVFTRPIASVIGAEGEQKAHQQALANFSRFVVTFVVTQPISSSI